MDFNVLLHVPQSMYFTFMIAASIHEENFASDRDVWPTFLVYRLTPPPRKYGVGSRVLAPAKNNPEDVLYRAEITKVWPWVPPTKFRWVLLLIILRALTDSTSSLNEK